MIYFFYAGLIACFIVMVVWPTFDEWFKDLEKGDATWDEDWDQDD